MQAGGYRQRRCFGLSACNPDIRRTGQMRGKMGQDDLHSVIFAAGVMIN